MDSEYKVFFMDVQNRTLYRQIKTGFPINRGSLKSKKLSKHFLQNIYRSSLFTMRQP